MNVRYTTNLFQQSQMLTSGCDDVAAVLHLACLYNLSCHQCQLYRQCYLYSVSFSTSTDDI